MAGLIRVDEMDSNSEPLMKFLVGAYNPVKELATVTDRVNWNPETFPVIKIIHSGGDEIEIHPTIPTVDGMYMTVIYPEVGTLLLDIDTFDPDIEIPDSSGGSVHRVYYSSGLRWKDA